jgi:protein-tyrosine phosphatase
MDKDNKELIEATVKGLQDKINQLNVELKDKQKELEDCNKPEITKLQMDTINDAVNAALENYHFDYEFDISYDNKLELSNLSFTDHYDIEEAIMTNITKQFKLPKDD